MLDLDRLVTEFIEAGPIGGLRVENLLELSGGFSGSVVVLVWVTGLNPLVMKFGPEPAIAREIAGRNAGYGHMSELERIGMAHRGPTHVVEAGAEVWSSLAYLWEGGLTYDQAKSRVSFASYLDEFNAGRVHPEALKAVFSGVLESVGAHVQLDPPGGAPGPLSTYLPPVFWESTVDTLLVLASQLYPSNPALSGFRAWYEDATCGVTISPDHDRRLIHADLWFANVLVDRIRSEPTVIDYGNAIEGHVFQDLARFEVDIWLEGLATRDEAPEASLAQITDAVTSFQLQLPTGEPETPLQLWRDALAEIRPTLARRSTFEMYLWFLLVDCIKRLRWLTSAEAAPATGPLLLDTIALIRDRLSRARDEGASPLALTALQRQLGVVAAYVPLSGEEAQSNRARNRAKQRAIRRAAASNETLRILAETGHAFLFTRGRFHDDITDLLENGGQLQVVLQDVHEGVRLLRARGRNAKDVASYERKSADALEGLKDLEARFGERIQCRWVSQALSATLLIAADRAFFEPYLPSDQRDRMRVLFDTFEVELDRPRAPHMVEVLEAHWTYLWGSADGASRG